MSCKDLKTLFLLLLVLLGNLKDAELDLVKKQMPATSNMLLKVFWGGTERNPSLWYIRYTVGFHKPEPSGFTTHSLEKSKLNCIQINEQCGFESSSVKWLQFTLFLPVQVLKWRELTWQLNGRLQPLTGRTQCPFSECTVMHCVCKRVCGLYWYLSAIS